MIAQGGEAGTQSGAQAQQEAIIIGVHGVGSPAVGSVADAISRGYARAYCSEQFASEPMLFCPSGAEAGISPESRSHSYRGLKLTSAKRQVSVWEVNWADLKGFPDGAIGTILYALKTVMAMIQISHTGWQKDVSGPTGPLCCGFLLRLYFCTFSLVAPICMLLVAFASIYAGSSVEIRASSFVAITTVVLAVAAASVIVCLLAKVDRLMWWSLVPLWLGGLSALWIIGHGPDNWLLIWLIRIISLIEGGLGIFVMLALIELLLRSIVRPTGPSNPTIFIVRAGAMILGATIGAAAYGAIVNAIGFFILSKLGKYKLVYEAAVDTFDRIYTGAILYDVAQMELVNGATTFFIGLFLITGVSYQFIRIGLSSNDSRHERGLYIRNTLVGFLWLALAGFLFILVCTFIDGFAKMAACYTDSLNCPAEREKLTSLYGIQWLLDLLGYRPSEAKALTPLDIYQLSATRIVPFLLPALIPPLRAGLNVTADVLLYVLPSRFPLSMGERARSRFRVLLLKILKAHPGAALSIFAYSQGTPIVRDVLSEESVGLRLLTAGSPLASLYQRFLGIAVTNPRANLQWINVFRPSDYIGGPLVEKSIEDKPWLRDYRDAHFMYFEDGCLIPLLLQSRDAAGN